MKDFIFRHVVIVSAAAAVIVAIAATGVAFADGGSDDAKPLTYMSIPF
jgi:hypothetical protein